MSKWLNAGTVLGGVGGAVTAAIALWQVFQPSPLDSVDEIVTALNRIGDALSSEAIDLSDADAQAQIANAAGPVSDLLARNLNALDAEQIARLGGVADARPGETVELLQPDGSAARVTFRQWNNSPPDVVLTFDGERVVTRAGWQGEVGQIGCVLIFAGPTRDEAPMARFRLSCP